MRSASGSETVAPARRISAAMFQTRWSCPASSAWRKTGYGVTPEPAMPIREIVAGGSTTYWWRSLDGRRCAPREGCNPAPHLFFRPGQMCTRPLKRARGHSVTPETRRGLRDDCHRSRPSTTGDPA